MVSRLSGMDAFFLSMEGTAWPQHTVGVMILDASEAQDYSYHKVKAHLASRLHLMPRFKCRIQEVPMQLDRPIWVEDDNFSIDAHVHHTALPAPGDDRELAEVVGEILARPLNRNQPLWESWYVEGLEGGRVAFIAKTHHAMVDGVSGAGLADVLCDISPNPAPRPDSLPEPITGQSSIELFGRGVITTVTKPPKVLQFLKNTVSGVVTTIGHMRKDNPPPRPMSAPRTVFNGVIGPRRGFAYGSLPMADVKLVKNSLGVKVNDVILSTVAGALRSYLLKRDELPETPVLATVPMSTRSADDVELGNMVHTMIASLATDIEDPVERLHAIHRGMNSAKELAEDMTKNAGVGLTDIASPLLMNLVFRGYQAAKLEQRLPLATNLIVSNVPGPPIPLYLAGAKIENIFSVGPLNMGMGMNITVFSYDGHVDVGIQVDPALVDDEWEMMSGVAAELQQLVDATR